MTSPHLDAGKYAAFVWAAYGVSATVLGAMIVDTLARARRWRRAAERLNAARRTVGPS